MDRVLFGLDSGMVEPGLVEPERVKPGLMQFVGRTFKSMAFTTGRT